MANVSENQYVEPDILETASIKPAPGWRARVALSDSDGHSFTAKDWEKCLAKPDSLYQNGEIIKAGEKFIVSVKKLRICDKTLDVVLKSQQCHTGPLNLMRSLLAPRAIRNFRTAQKLYRKNLPVARPLAAIWKKSGPFAKKSIYISEYISGPGDLYTFIKENADFLEKNGSALKKDLSYQMAGLFASLHKASLWHRDAKANNFLVRKTQKARYKLALVDMDGIKPYGLRRQRQRFRCLSKIASTLLWNRAVSTSDYLRTFYIYSNLTGLDYNKRRRVFRSLKHQAVATRLLTLAKSAMESPILKDSEENKTRTPKRILIIKPSALGDIVLALPALASLRKSLPDAEISWFIRLEYAPLLAGVSGIDDIIIFDRKLLGKWWYNPKAFAALLRLIRQLQSADFDLVIDLQGLFRTALFARLTGCKKRFGMKDAREFAALFYTHKVERDYNRPHIIDCYQKIVSAAGASGKSYRFNLRPNKKAVDGINALLLEQNINPERYAVFVPSSAHFCKCWPVQNFAALADKITSQFGLSIIAVGKKTEKALIHTLQSEANVKIADFAGLTDIPQLVALLNGAKVVVSNDTGPGHIAAALGVPVVIIFGATNPARICPYGREEAVAAIDPQNRGREIESSNPKHAIENVTVEQVLQKVTFQLKQNTKNPAKQQALNKQNQQS